MCNVLLCVICILQSTRLKRALFYPTYTPTQASSTAIAVNNRNLHEQEAHTICQHTDKTRVLFYTAGVNVHASNKSL